MLRGSEMPEHFEILSSDDQERYLRLQKDTLNDGKRSPKYAKTKLLEDNLEKIRKFCIRKDEDDIKRCLVCGILWVDEGLCVNIIQLQKLFGKCKSSINTSFRNLGYELTQSRCDSSDPLKKVFAPIQDLTQLRQWTIRTNPKDFDVDEARRKLHSKPGLLFLNKHKYNNIQIPHAQSMPDTIHFSDAPPEQFQPEEDQSAMLPPVPESTTNETQEHKQQFEFGFLDDSFIEMMQFCNF